MTSTSQPISTLIVEDTPEHVTLIEHILGASTFPRFKAASSGTMADALSKFKAGKFDVVLLDLTLPDSAGNETFRKINEAAPDSAVVILSGVGDVARSVEMLKLGAQDYLVKGHVDGQLLIRSMQYALERKRTQVALRQAHDQLEQRVQERTIALVETNKQLQSEITERTKAEAAAVASNQELARTLDELRVAQQEVIHRERLVALGQMAGGIAHEFNNILTPIIAWSDRLLNSGEHIGGYAARDTLEKIRAAAGLGAKAVARVREFADAKAASYRAINPSDLIAQVIAVTEARWKDEALAGGVTIDVRTQTLNVPDILADAPQIRDLLTQLIFNAVNAIPRRGSITLSTAFRGNEVILSVRDDGLGMNRLDCERCLDPNLGGRHTDGRSSGYGIIHGILQRHNAKLEIDSGEGRGTRVNIIFPAAPLEAEKPATPAPVAAPSTTTPATAITHAPQSAALKEPKARARRVLVVEDDYMVREVMITYLEEDSYHVTAAENGREGIEIFNKQPGAFDLVVTDRAMPEMNGDQLAKEIKRTNPAMPVILLTGFGDIMISDGEKPDGVDLVVGKPFTMSSLREALAKVR